MKKFLKQSVLLAASFLTLSSGGFNLIQNTYAQDVVEISYALWDTEQEKIVQELVAEFEEQHPNIKINIELTPFSQYWTRLETAITGNNAPDVFWLNIPNSLNYIENGVIEPLDNYNIDVSNFPEQYLETYSYEGSLYGIPRDFDTNALWYNKAIFDEMGVEYPDDTWTWDDWLQAAIDLTDEEKGIYGMATPVTWQGGYYDTIYQNEGTPFVNNGEKSGFDLPETIEGVEFWHSFSANNAAVPMDMIANTVQKELFLSGKVAMIVDGSWMVPVYFSDEYGLENIDIAPLPQGKVRATTSNSLANVISSTSEHKEEAALWLEFISSEHANKKFAESGAVIPAYNDTQEAWVNAYPDKNLQVFVDAVEYAVPLSNFRNANQAIAQEQDLFNQVWVGNMTIEEAAAQLVEIVNQLLAQ